MDMSSMMAESITAALAENGYDGVEVSLDEGNNAHLHGVVGSEDDVARVVELVRGCGVADVIPDLHVDGGGEEVGDVNTYTVQKGDSWWKIAADHYGKGTLHAALKEANGSPKMLHPGDVIVIPDVEELGVA